MALAGIWEDNFEYIDPTIGSAESAWEVIIDQGDPLAKNGGQLELKAPSAGGRDEIATPSATQGVNDSVLQAEFPAQIPLEKTEYGIEFLNESNSYVTQLLVATSSGSTRVFFVSGNPIAYVDYATGLTTLKMVRNSSNEIRAYFVQGVTETPVGSPFTYTGPLKGGLYGASSLLSINPVDFLCNSFSYSSDGISRNIVNGEKNTAPNITDVVSNSTVDKLELDITRGNPPQNQYNFNTNDPNGDLINETVKWFKSPNYGEGQEIYTGETLNLGTLIKDDIIKFKAIATDTPPIGTPKTTETWSNEITITDITPVNDWILH